MFNNQLINNSIAMLNWNTFFKLQINKNICLEIIILKKSQADMLKLQFKNKYSWWPIIQWNLPKPNPE